MSEFKLVVFDLAGTTIKDNGQMSHAFAAALSEHDIEFTPDRLSCVRGSSKREAVLSFVPEGPERTRRAESVYDTFRAHLAELYRAGGVEPIAGAETIFHRLRTQGVRVALNTGFDRDLTELLLRSLNWNDSIVDAVVCGDQVREGRPAPYLIFHAMEATATTSVRQVANVGDTVLDLRAGDNAGVRWNIGVLSGAHDRRLLESAPHTHLLPSIEALFDVWFTE